MYFSDSMNISLVKIHYDRSPFKYYFPAQMFRSDMQT